MYLVEAVPNFSTSDIKIVSQIKNTIEEFENTYVLDIDINIDYNRSVITFLTTLDMILDVSFSCIAIALDLIDMAHHKGEHPRLGAVDVFPLIALNNTPKVELIELSHKLAKLVGTRLKIPVFCYAQSALKKANEFLSTIRINQYEGLKDKFQSNMHLPDYGPSVFKPKSGVVTIGVREILIAYNVNLNTTNKKIANDISRIIRTSGYNLNGQHINGKLKGVQALGFKCISNRDFTQVSTNILNYKNSSSIFDVYENVLNEAHKLNISVSGSEIVGLIPMDALLFGFCDDDNSTKINKINRNIDELGLNDLYNFIPDLKILEFQIEKYFSGYNRLK